MSIRQPHTQRVACWGLDSERDRQRRAPILETLTPAREAGLASFHCPGHKNGSGAASELVELLGTELFASDIWLPPAAYAAALREAEALAAGTWGAERACFLVNGSSSGNHAFLLATLTPGDEVIVARDIHASLLTALILTGARPVYVTPRFHPAAGVSLGIAAEDVAGALDDHPGARLVVLASPSYYSIAADLPAIAAAARARGVPVYVDEAWGPHLSFHPELPPSAMQAGADAAVTSAHRLLGSLSQSALLLLRGARLDLERVAAAVAMTQSTSPFLPFLASLDTARRQMALNGAALVERVLRLARDARAQLARLHGIEVLDGQRLGLARYDATRLVIDVQGLGLTGYAAEALLRARFGIAPEMSDHASVVCLLTIGDSSSSVARLIDAFRGLCAAHAPGRPGSERDDPRSLGGVVAAGPQVLSPREAFFAPARPVPLGASVGEVAAELVVPYPPGVPVIAPGELITADKVAYLRAELERGMCVRGASDRSLASVRVIA